MKKTLLLIFTMLASLGAWATNYASGISPTIFFNPSGNTYLNGETDLKPRLTDGIKTGGEYNALILSNSAMTVCDAFYLDLGSERTIAGFEITWTGKHCKLYKLYGTNTAPTTCTELSDLNTARASWTLLYNNLSDPVTEQLAADQQKTVTHVSTDKVNGYRYIVFVPLNDGGAYDMYYGAGIVELEVLDALPGAVLTTISATASNTALSLAAAETATISTTGHDQYGEEIATGELTYTTSPTGIVTVNENGIVTPVATGSTTVTVSANSGAITTTVDISVYSGAFNVPTAAPAAPTILKENVIALYSEEYNKPMQQEGKNGPVSGWGTGAYSFTTCEEVTLADGRKVVHIIGNKFNTRTKDEAKVTSDYTKAYVQIYPKVATTGYFYADGIKLEPQITGLIANQWNSIALNITPSENKDYMEVCLDGETEFYLDNFYFADATTTDTERPGNPTVTATPSGKTASLSITATDNNEGMLTYSIKNGSTEIATARGRAGTATLVTITGLTSETEYTLSVTATDAAGNVCSTAGSVTFTTTTQPMRGDFTTTTYNSSNPAVNGKSINYTCAFTQTGNDVTVTFTYTTPENIPGLVFNGVTATGGNVPEKGSYKWTGCADKTVLHAHSSWAAESGGMAETQEFYYVVAGENAGLVKMPADDNDIIEILGTGTVTVDAFKALTTTTEKAYDLTNLSVSSAVALEANNKNAVFIVKESQKTNLNGTNNLLVWDEGNSRYASDEITITDQPSAFNLFASNLPIYTTDAKYVRESVGANQYFTVALPFAGNTPENFSAYTAGVASANVTFTKVASGEMAKANPYVIHNVNESEADFIVTATDVNAVLDFTETKPDNSCMESVFTIQNTSSLTTDIYALMADPNDAGKVVFHAAKGVTLIPFRAIFRGSSLATARAIFLDGETTKIGAIDVDGKIETGAIYNLAGQRVQNPTKGIYIINGKKVVLK